MQSLGSRALILTLLCVLCVTIATAASSSEPFPEDERLALKEDAREMFNHAYSAYMENAYPADELLPLSCSGRYRDASNPRGDIDDVLGNFSLTLIDSLSTLVVMGELREFDKALQLIVRDVTFDTDVWVSVFEANIRVLGGLVSGHVLALHVQRTHGAVPWYSHQLLHLATDLATRLLPAFNTSTGLPRPRVNLRHGATSTSPTTSTCTSCAGSMILEFASLSRLTGLKVFEEKARRTMDVLWRQRNRLSNLPGTVLDVTSGAWLRRDSGVGAGVDSYYEYLLKGHILLGEPEYLRRFQLHYDGVMKYMGSSGVLLIDVQMHRPNTHSRTFCDAFQAFWPGLQVLNGDLTPAIELHQMLYQVTRKHTFLPEAFTTDLQVHWGQYPLRPEFLESTYLLYEATRDPHYLRVGREALKALQQRAWVPCGYAAIQDVRTGQREDRMDSFVLAETFKYLYLLFSKPEELPLDLDDFVFSTEGHPLPLDLARYAVNVTTSETWTTAHQDVASQDKTHGEDKDVVQGEDKDVAEGEWLEDDDEGCSPLRATCPRADVPGRAGVIRTRVDEVELRKLQPHMARPRRLEAAHFSSDKPEHLAILKDFGVAFSFSGDGTMSFTSSPGEAKSVEDASEAEVFMQEMSQMKEVDGGPKGVVFSRPHNCSHAVLGVTGAGGAYFGPPLRQGHRVEGRVFVASPLHACRPLTNGAGAKGRVVVVGRGDCMFMAKARVLQSHGAIGGIVLDNQPTPPNTPMFKMLGDNSTDDVTIPLVFLFAGPAGMLRSAIKTAKARNEFVTVVLTELTEALTRQHDAMVSQAMGAALKDTVERVVNMQDISGGADVSCDNSAYEYEPEFDDVEEFHDSYDDESDDDEDASQDVDSGVEIEKGTIGKNIQDFVAQSVARHQAAEKEEIKQSQDETIEADATSNDANDVADSSPRDEL